MILCNANALSAGIRICYDEVSKTSGDDYMFFFNREEVYTGFSMKDAHNVMDILQENGIKYQYKVINLTQKWTERGITRNTSGSIGINRDYSMEHIVYVKRDNLEEADFLIKTYFKRS